MALTKVRGSGLDGATALKGQELVIDADGDTSIDASSADDTIIIDTAGSERIRLDADGNLLSGKASTAFGTVGHRISPIGFAHHTRTGGSNGTDPCLGLNLLSNDGNLVEFYKDSSQVGSIGTESGHMTVGNGDTGLQFNSNDRISPFNTTSNSVRDDAIDLGEAFARFDDIHATNGTIQTSDQNEKQDIASATAKELNVAKKLSALFKTFRWKSKVAEKGDKARTHTGIIAQEIQSAFSAEGLDASDYGLFISDTWTNDDGKEQTRLGVRYPELFSFIFSSIEARLTALESK
jgi:hypothetical protein